MIRVSVLRITTFPIPMGCMAPALATIRGQVQINSTTNYVIWIRGVDDNRIVVGNLAFLSKMISADLLPGVTAIRAAKDPEHKVAALATFIGGESVEHIGL